MPPTPPLSGFRIAIVDDHGEVLLNELVKQLPDGVYISQVKQDNQVVTVNGVARDEKPFGGAALHQ